MSDFASVRTRPAHAAMVSQFAPSDYTVLVVDGDQQVRRDLTALLSRAGYHTRAFNSAGAVLAAIGEHPDHVCVISEIELPDMTGLDLISRLRAENSKAPVVILTGLGDVATAVRAMRDRVSDYLVKPYVERDLINRLKSVLIKRQDLNG